MDRKTDEQTDGQKDKLTNRWKERQMDSKKNEQTDGKKDRWTERQMD
jgi:hypothetical protein